MSQVFVGCDRSDESRHRSSGSGLGSGLSSEGSESAAFVGDPDSSGSDPDSGADTGSSTEVCNGVDDDEDGEVDEDLADIECGIGECAVFSPSCIAGVGTICTPQIEGAPLAESCNGLDDDCDGETDEADVCGAESGGSESGGNIEDPPPDPSAYTECVGDADCAAQDHCVEILGYCSATCGSDADCPAPVSGSAVAACDEPTSTCYLVCATGTCPASMTCVEGGVCQY